MTKTQAAPAGTDDEYFTREEVLSADDVRYTVVDVPEWNSKKKLRLRSMRARDRDRIEAMVTQVKGKGRTVVENIRATVVAVCAVNGAGETIFTTEDIEALGERDAAAMDRAFDAAWKLSGMGVEAVKAIEAELKNAPAAAG